MVLEYYCGVLPGVHTPWHYWLKSMSCLQSEKMRAQLASLPPLCPPKLPKAPQESSMQPDGLNTGIYRRTDQLLATLLKLSSEVKVVDITGKTAGLCVCVCVLCYSAVLLRVRSCGCFDSFFCGCCCTSSQCRCPAAGADGSTAVPQRCSGQTQGDDFRIAFRPPHHVTKPILTIQKHVTFGFFGFREKWLNMWSPVSLGRRLPLTLPPSRCPVLSR